MALDALVTGGTGVLGRRIISELRSAGHESAASGRVSSGDTDIAWDISSQDAPEQDCKPAVVVHSAARIGHYQQSLSQANDLFEVNVRGTLRIARWCVEQKVRRLVLVSSAIVYGEWGDSAKLETDPAQPWAAGAYAVSKWCGEQVAQMVISTGVELVILRLSSLIGTGYDQSMIARMLRDGRETGEIKLEPPWEDAFDLLHVSDAARVIRRAVENGRNGLWNVGSGELTNITELADMCAEEVGAQVVFGGSKSARPARILNWVDDRKARIELGHTNQKTLRQGIKEIAQSAQ